METEQGLSRSIKYQAKKYLECVGVHTEAPTSIAGVPIEYPYSAVGNASWDSFIPAEDWENYQAMETLFEEKTIPPLWIPFIREVYKERTLHGSQSPVDLVNGLLFLSKESPLTQHDSFFKFQTIGEETIDFRNGEAIGNAITEVLANPILRKEYKHILCSLIPDTSYDRVDKELIQHVLKKTGITQGICVDFGCGVGIETGNWAKQLKFFTILGLERQYHPQWYDPYWKEKPKQQKNLHFMRGDFQEGVPLRENSVDVALLQFVAQHITQKSVQKMLQETRRVLKPDGWLFVGPQYTEDFSNMRMFRKEVSPEKTTYMLKEYHYDDKTQELTP